MARLTNAFLQYSDDAGKPIPEGKLYFYDSGTTNLRNTYIDSGLSIPNANPLILDGAGRVNAPFLDGNYRVILTDKDDNQIREIDPVQGSLSDSQWSDWSISTTYGTTDIVRASNGEYCISLTGSNLGNDPISSPANWSQISFVTVWNINETYSENDNVFESGTQYKSLVDGNIGNLPSTSPAQWGVPTGGVVAGNPVSVLTNDVPYLAAGNDLSDVADAPTSRTNLGIGNVDNTSDADKPVSTSTQAALDLKVNTSDVDVNANANTIVKRDPTGYVFAHYYNSSGVQSNIPSIGGFVVRDPTNNGYLYGANIATAKSALNIEPTNWVLKWSGSATSVPNSWGDGRYLIRLDMPSANDYSFEIIVSGSIKIGVGMWFNPYVYGVLYSGTNFVTSCENGLPPITTIMKAE